ncbi:MAG: carboxylating nicotinate-nucleotide diphosphorylase [Deltaproteobacteria bacterium]|nr:carboxylating nicotinate-nucleotide diphosphorylase [Deltaproteobacteria bacterium]
MGLKEYVDLLIQTAFTEDASDRDVTTQAIVHPQDECEAHLLAKEPLTLAGLFVAEAAFKRLDKRLRFKAYFKDGDSVKKGAVIARVSGRCSCVLTAERVALNFLQRLSGVATATRRLAVELKGTKTRLLDTRKTTPCLRLLERYAVRSGGGFNHRFGLSDEVLIKDNHIMAAGGVGEALARVSGRYREGVLVEVEVTNLKEVREALAGHADIILLDNMTIAMMRKAVKIINNAALVEASGGITVKNAAAIAATGVNFISSGAITHSARAVDISLEVASISCGKRTRPKLR